jgi:hypothetical protein
MRVRKACFISKNLKYSTPVAHPPTMMFKEQLWIFVKATTLSKSISLGCNQQKTTAAETGKIEAITLAAEMRAY